MIAIPTTMSNPINAGMTNTGISTNANTHTIAKQIAVKINNVIIISTPFIKDIVFGAG